MRLRVHDRVASLVGWLATYGPVAVLLFAAGGLLALSDTAAERSVALERADPRLKRTVGEQRMWTERIAQTAARLAAAPGEGRGVLAEELEDAVVRWRLPHAAFRSVAAGPYDVAPALPVMDAAGWDEMDSFHRELQTAALSLVSEARADAIAPERARGIARRAASLQLSTDRWLRALERDHEERLRGERTQRRLSLAGAASAAALAFVVPGGFGRRSLRSVRKRLAESERRHRLLVERCPNGVIVASSGRLRFANPAAARLLGGAERALVGRRVTDLVHPEDRRVLSQQLVAVGRGEAAEPVELRLASPDGTETRVLVHAASVVYDGRRSVEAILVDVTDQWRSEERRRAMEARLHSSERLESLAVMAGGVAHDFNNLLAAILANAELALAEGAPEGPLEDIVQTSHAASRLVTALLTYAGEGILASEEVDLGELSAEALRLLMPSVPSRVLVQLDAAPGLPPITGDRTQLLQVAMNLLTNAIEAIGDAPGRIELRVDARVPDERFRAACESDAIPEGRCVELDVQDTGAGMDATTRAHVFDPFYSTKFAGRGLGLAAVLGIVRRHGGAIAVESEPARGSRFRVALPAEEESS